MPRQTIEKAYTAIVCGDGRILPIAESVGRRVLREIDPDSKEGSRLLREGKVTLWSDDGHKARRLPVDAVLREMDAGLKARLALHRGVKAWRSHHREIARSIARTRQRFGS